MQVTTVQQPRHIQRTAFCSRLSCPVPTFFLFPHAWYSLSCLCLPVICSWSVWYRCPIQGWALKLFNLSILTNQSLYWLLLATKKKKELRVMIIYEYKCKYIKGSLTKWLWPFNKTMVVSSLPGAYDLLSHGLDLISKQKLLLTPG